MGENIFRIRLIAIVFILIISFPLINDKLNLVQDIPSSENRKMATEPSFDIKHLDPYPAKYEEYYNDNFTIRSLLVKQYNQLNLTVFKKSPLPDKVLIGNEGWLFLADDEHDSYERKNCFNKSELEAFKKELDYRRQYLKERGCKFYFLIAPAKANIYSNKIPNDIFRHDKQSWGEQLIEYLNANNGVKPINVFNALRSNKEKENLYFKLDNHWNQLGAFYATNEVLKNIKIDFPEISSLPLNQFKIRKIKSNEGNIVDMLSTPGIFTDFTLQISPKAGFKSKEVPKVGYPVIKGFPINEYELTKEIKGSKKPKILIISDSFGNCVYPFISEQFSRSVKIFDAWQLKLNEDIINSEKPDIVLLISLESHLRNILEYGSSSNKVD